MKCQSEGCVTVLSSYNPGPYCYAHTPPFGSKLLSTYKRPATRSEKFIANIPGSYDIPPEARGAIKRGGGA